MEFLVVSLPEWAFILYGVILGLFGCVLGRVTRW